jgi:hypothetical protein
MNDVKDNAEAYRPTEQFTADWFNAHEQGTYFVVGIKEPRFDVAGTKCIEVKSYKIKYSPCIPRDTLLRCQADYVAFVQVENKIPTGKLTIALWSELKKHILSIPEDQRWKWVDGYNGKKRQVFFISEYDLSIMWWATDVDDYTRVDLDTIFQEKRDAILA